MSQPIYSVYIKPPEISTFLEKLIQYKYWLAVNWALLTCSRTVLYCLNWWNLFSLLNLISFWPYLDKIPFARLHLFHSLLWGCLFQLARVVESRSTLPCAIGTCRRKPTTQFVFYKKDLGQHQSYLLETFGPHQLQYSNCPLCNHIWLYRAVFPERLKGSMNPSTGPVKGNYEKQTQQQEA